MPTDNRRGSSKTVLARQLECSTKRKPHDAPNKDDAISDRICAGVRVISEANVILMFVDFPYLFMFPIFSDSFEHRGRLQKQIYLHLIYYFPAETKTLNQDL